MGPYEPICASFDDKSDDKHSGLLTFVFVTRWSIPVWLVLVRIRGCGAGTRTRGLRVMGPASCRCSTPRRTAGLIIRLSAF